jgi:hypothetical protein
MKRLLSCTALCGGLLPALMAQVDTVLLQQHGLYTFSTPFHSVLSSQLDRNGAPYLYAACMERGLVTLDITDLDAPVPIDTITVAAFGGLAVGNVTQYGDLLYVPLGGPLGGDQNAGLGIVDVSVPDAPSLVSYWDTSAWTNGSAIVRLVGDIAYLGAMEEGIVVLNVADPANIEFISHYLPDVDWPGINNYPPNARGMDIVGNVLFLAYDAGALRAIDISDPENLSEIGHYVNPQQPAFTPVAYNNLRVIGDHAFIALDYCGVEVVNVSDPADMQQVTWLNPWNCIGLSWFGSDGHTNEVVTAQNDSLLFLSGADSEVLIYNISDPASPVLAGGFIHPNDSAAAWGIDLRDSLLAVNYIYNAGLPVQPYYSNIGGVQLFTWSTDFTTSSPGTRVYGASVHVAPNPSTGIVQLWSDVALNGILRVRDAQGRELFARPLQGRSARLDLSALVPGIHSLSFEGADGSRWSERLILQ